MNTDICTRDTLARESIVRDTDKSIFVEASAGSGKTTGLTDRLLAMVCKGIDVSEICAITFTKAAAREIYSRFRKKLADTAAETNDADIRSRCENALKNIDLCFLGTIDSFCNTIISEHPNEARIPASASVISAEQLAVRCRREYSAIISGETTDSELKAKAELLAVYIPREDTRRKLFNSLLDKLISHRESDIVFEPPVTDPDTAFAYQYDVLKKVCLALIGIKDDIMNGKNKPPKEAVKEIEARAYIFERPLSKVISEAVAVTGQLKKMQINEIPADILAAAPQLFCKCSRKNCDYYETDTDELQRLFGVFEEAQYSALMDFTTSAIDTITSRLREMGELTFYDYLLYLRGMLRDDAVKGGRLISYINRRYKYFLVDEFQDTDPLQAEIIFCLTAKEPKTNWYDCVPRPGSLFIVGDPKQSIYRFKGADVSSFKRIRKMFEDPEVGEIKELTRNFRSTPELCRWFNEVFTKLLPADTENNSRYAPIPVDENAADTAMSGVYRYRCVKKDVSSTADVIRSLVGVRKISRKDSQGNTYADDISFSDIMVIVGSKDNAGLYMQGLTNCGIPVMAEGKVIFSDCPILKHLAAVLRAVSFPDDAEAVYAVLTSPIFGITNDELAALSMCGEKKERYRLSLFSFENKALDRVPKAKSAMKKLYDIYTRVSPLPASAAADIIMRELSLYELFDSVKPEYYYYALELLRTAESTGAAMTLKDGSELLTALVEGTVSEERCISLQKGIDRVRVANLHKVKGLEAPVVILAEPGGRRDQPASASVRTEKGEDFYVFSASTGDSYFRIGTKKYDDVMHAEAERIEAEHLRLLYVAATRAQNILLISYSEDSKGNISTSKYWYDLVRYCKQDFHFSEKAVMAVPTKKEISAEDLAANAVCADLTDKAVCSATYTIERPSDIKSAKNSDEDISADTALQSCDDSSVKSALSHIPANTVGTMAHRLMEILVTSNGRAERDSSVSEIINDYYHEDGPLRDALTKLWDTMMNGGYKQENGSAADLLSELQNAECHCELPFCTYSADTGVTVNGVMDLVYKKNGRWYIVDYKTNFESSGLDEKYSTQLSAYQKAFKELTGADARCRIYHIPIHTS